MNGDAYKYIRFNTSQETRWATVEEIKHSCARIDLHAKDYPAAGLPILSDTNEAYVDNADTHTLIFGATGSKKTRLFCMPMINMMAKAGESFIVTDPKGELYAQTSALVHEKGYKTVVLNFRDIGYGDRWNPLSIPYELWKAGYRDEAGALLSDVMGSIAAPIAKNNKDAFWPEAAQELGIAGLYTLFEAAKPEEIHMKSFAMMSSQGSVDHMKSLYQMMREDSLPYINYSSTIGLDAKVTASGIISSLFGMLRLFCVNNKLTHMLAETTFDMKKIGREKTAVYLIVPDEKTTYHFLVTMFIKQVYEVLIGEAQKEATRTLPVRVNFVLDEFCNIPMIPDMHSMISAARSRNMRYFLVVQSMHQLKGRYGENADTIKGNCDNWVFLTSKERDLLTEISELCGNIVTPDGRIRCLISTSELQRFSKERGEALIMHCRQYPIISELPDISMYPMFGRGEAIPVEPYDFNETPCFSLVELLAEIENHTRLAPFASNAHINDQAREIYEEEQEKLGLTEMLLFGRGRHRPRLLSWMDDEENAREDEDLTEEERLERERVAEEELRKLEEERKEKIEIAQQRTKERLERLVSPAFAEAFIASLREDSSADDDSDR